MKTDTLEALPESKLVKDQKLKFGPRAYTEDGERRSITATVRYDDQCGNGHNSFAITAEIRGPRGFWCGGCCHDEVAKHFPELAPFIKWHLTSSDGPMHYIANTVYHAESGNMDYARSSAVWPEATDAQLCAPPEELKAMLLERLPALVAEFKRDVESLGFVY